jgi:murein L,D-transpeptidase YafK
MTSLYSKYCFLLLFSFFLLGCSPDVPKNRYDLSECKKELLEAKHFQEEMGIDHIIVHKKERMMYLYKDQELIQEIPISLGKNPLGHKVKQGDCRTPEGEYFIRKKICSPKYYRSLSISYPRPIDSQKAKEKGVKAGGDITIHAQPKWNDNGKSDDYTLSKDWTKGCMAVSNSIMKELWYVVAEGIPITIKE